MSLNTFFPSLKLRDRPGLLLVLGLIPVESLGLGTSDGQKDKSVFDFSPGRETRVHHTALGTVPKDTDTKILESKLPLFL